MSADPGKPTLSKQQAREERRAAALRENLRRRKSQARARAAPETAPGRSPEAQGTGGTAER